MGAIYKNKVKYAGTASDAKNISYDKTKSGLNAENVQDGVDELDQKLSSLFTYNSSTGALTIDLDAL